MTNNRNAYLAVPGDEPDAVLLVPTTTDAGEDTYSIIIPSRAEIACGRPDSGEFVLEHHRGEDSFTVKLTRETENGASSSMRVSVRVPAALVRALLDRTPDVRS